MEIRKLRFEDIEVPDDRARPINKEKIDRITVSMRENGQFTAIEVIEQSGREHPYRLVYGEHRWTAAQLAPLDGIWASIYSGDASKDVLRRREIDENLARSDLTAYDRANFIAERAAIWARTKSEQKQSRKPLGHFANRPGPRFDEVSAMELGVTDRDVRHHNDRINKTVPAVWAALRGSPAADNGLQLDKISKLTPEQQKQLLEALRPALTLPKKEFNAAFATAYNAIKGIRPASQKTDKEIAQALAANYRDLKPEIQRMFRLEVGLEVAKPKSRAPRKAAVKAA